MRIRTSLAIVTFLLLAALLAVSSPVRAAPLGVGEQRRVLGAAEVALLRDPGGALGIGDITRPERQAQFVPAQGELPIGFTRDAIWLRIVVQRTAQAPAQWRLVLRSWAIDDVRFYAPQGPTGYRSSQAGSRHAFAARDVPYRAPAFAIDLPDTAAHTYYLRMASESSLTSALVLWSAPEFAVSTQRETLLLGLLLGLAAMSGLLSLLDWALNRDRLQLALAGVQLLLLGCLLAYTGLANQYLFAHTPHWGNAFPIVVVSLFFAWAITCFRGVLEIRATLPWLDYSLLLCAALCLMALAASRLLGLSWIGGPALNVVTLWGLLVNALAAFVQWRRGREGAGWFFAAFGSFAVAIWLILLTSFGVAAGLGFLREPALYVGSAAFSVIAQLGVLTQLRAARREREAARREAAVVQSLAQQDRQLREEQTVFFSFVAHELRTPLGVVRAGMHNLERELDGAATPVRQRARRIRGAAERMAALLDRHLQLQRLDRADFELVRTPATAEQPARAALAAAADSYPQRHFEWQAPSQALPVVGMDVELMTLALLNLLSNAAKYSPEETPVRLTVELRENRLGYGVLDQGAGMAAPEAQRLFQAFTRAPGSRSQAGFGLGLALARRIAQLHGGTLTYQRPESGGTLFMLTVPVAAQSP